MKLQSLLMSVFLLILCTNTLAVNHPIFSKAFTESLTCPPSELIKSVKLIKAMRDSYDDELWNFSSTTFWYEGVEWNVAFGTFFPEAKTEETALIQGQAYFDRSPVVIFHPNPVKITKFLICDYMPTGRDYWLAALSPPKD